MAKFVNPKDLDFRKDSIHTSFVGQQILVLATLRSFISCKIFFSSVKSHRNDDEWLKKEYDKLMEDYKRLREASMGPTLDIVATTKWKMEACHLMLTTPKNQRDKVDFEFVKDEKYYKHGKVLGIDVNTDHAAVADGYDYKIVNKSKIKK